MKQMSIHSINITLTKLRAYPTSFWSSLKVKAFSTIGSLTTALAIIALAICLYFKCFGNKMGYVHKHTRPTTLPNKDPYIELKPITNPTPETSDQLSQQLVQEILKASGVDMSKFKHHKDAKHYIRHQLSLLSYHKSKNNFWKSSLIAYNKQIWPC